MVYSHSHISFNEQEMVKFLEKRGWIIASCKTSCPIMVDNRLETKISDTLIAYKPSSDLERLITILSPIDISAIGANTVQHVFPSEYKKFMLSLMGI